MLDDKKIEESSKVIKQLISDRKIVKPNPRAKDFFIKQSRKCMIVAQKLLEMQSKEGIDTNLWVINSSYYSMFFAATALLAHFNKKIDVGVGVHKMTYHALVYFFVKEDNKLKKALAEEYALAVNDIEQTLQLGEEKIKDLVTSFDYELNKRKDFTYEIQEDLKQSKALTSFKRAEKFLQEVNNILLKK
jgi:uncharacterized protein (UPF0332 family)